MLELNLYKNLIKGETIIKYPLQIVNNYEFSFETIDLLINIGLPRKIQPFIWFLSIDKGGFQRLGDYYFKISNIEKQECINEIIDELNKLVVIGKSNGNAICFNDKKQLMWIDYEDLTEMSVNNSFEEFIECIVCFNNFINTITNKYGKSVKYYDFISQKDILNLKKQLNSICSGKLSESDFWISKLMFLEDKIKI